MSWNFIGASARPPENYRTVFLRTSPPSLGRDTLGLGTPGTLWGWELQGHSGGWALHFGVGHSRHTLGLGTPGTFWGWALQGHFRVRHRVGTAGTFWG